MILNHHGELEDEEPITVRNSEDACISVWPMVVCSCELNTIYGIYIGLFR